jgi:hypothetical protein
VGGDEVISSAVVPPECHRRIRGLYDYWCGIHPTEAILPGRQHVEPLDLPEVLRWLCWSSVSRCAFAAVWSAPGIGM